MLFCVIHLDSEPSEGEEVYLLVPEGSKVAVAVRLDALPATLPLLKQACNGCAPPTCPSCAARLPAAVSESD